MLTSSKILYLAYGAFKFLNGIIIVYQVFNRNNVFVFVLFLLYNNAGSMLFVKYNSIIVLHRCI